MTNLKSAFSLYNKKVEKSKQQLTGLLGIQMSGNKLVQHPTRNGFVYVRIGDNLSETIVAFNDKVSPVYDLPVIITRMGNKWSIFGKDTDRYSNWGTSSPFLPQHGIQHSLNREQGTGADAVAIYPDQFMPLLVYPSGTAGASNLQVSPYMLKRTADFIYVGNTGTPNILQYKPTNNQALMGLVYLDRTTGNPGILVGSGTLFSGTVTGTAQIAPYLPYPTSNQEPLYAFRLVSGTSALLWENLYNLRQFVGGGTGGGSVIASGTYTPGILTADRVVVTSVSGTVGTDDNLQWNNTYKHLEIGQPPQNSAIGGLQIGRDSGDNNGGQGGNAGAFATLFTWGTAAASFIKFYMAGGTKASPTAVPSGTVIGRVNAGAYDGVTSMVATPTQAQMRMITTETHSPTSKGTQLELLATRTGTTTLVPGLQVTPDFINLPSPSGTYNVNGTPINPPATTALNDVQVGNGSGSWIKKTLAEFLTILNLIPANGWIPTAATGVSGTLDSPSFEISFNADMTGLIGLGYRIKVTQSTTKFFIVTKVGAYSGGNTIITCYGGTDYTLVATATTAITNPYYSPVKNPFGFPDDSNKWEVEVSNTSLQTQASPTANTWYNTGSIAIGVPIGVWDIEYFTMLRSDGAGNQSVFATLSTANNTESDNDFRVGGGASGSENAFEISCYRRKTASITTKATMYLNISSALGTLSNIRIRGDYAKTIIRAKCAYL